MRHNAGAPVNGTSEVQTVTVNGSPTGGTFRLQFRGHVTDKIAYNAATSAVQTALRHLSSIGSDGVTVSGSAGSYTVTFAGRLQKQNVPTLASTDVALVGGTSPTVDVAVTTPGVDATALGAAAYEQLMDDTNGVLYVNLGTAAAPDWQVVKGQANAGGQASFVLTSDVALIHNAGAPTDGGSGTGQGVAGKGSLCIDRTNGNLYINAGTKSSPTWKLVTRAA